LTHNWWHAAVCYLEGNAPTQRVLEIYDNYIWKELDKDDSMKAEVCDFISFVFTSSVSCFLPFLISSNILEYRFT